PLSNGIPIVARKCSSINWFNMPLPKPLIVVDVCILTMPDPCESDILYLPPVIETVCTLGSCWAFRRYCRARDAAVLSRMLYWMEITLLGTYPRSLLRKRSICFCMVNVIIRKAMERANWATINPFTKAGIRSADRCDPNKSEAFWVVITKAG